MAPGDITTHIKTGVWKLTWALPPESFVRIWAAAGTGEVSDGAFQRSHQRLTPYLWAEQEAYETEELRRLFLLCRQNSNICLSADLKVKVRKKRGSWRCLTSVLSPSPSWHPTGIHPPSLKSPGSGGGDGPPLTQTWLHPVKENEHWQ